MKAKWVNIVDSFQNRNHKTNDLIHRTLAVNNPIYLLHSATTRQRDGIDV